MKRLATRTLATALFFSAAALPLAANAHDQWIVPSSTVLSGQSTWITVDAAVGNDKFYFDHAPMRLDNLAVTAPDGSAVPAENMNRGKLRSTFDVPLAQVGTYRIAVVNDGVFARWKEGGTPKRYFGKADGLAQAVPAQAQDLEVTQSLGRVETFVTVGKPSALKPSGKGLELQQVTHPNDLVSGEKATFELLLDGKPANEMPVMVVPGGSRYRDKTEEVKLQTDKDGRFAITWPHAGMYWLEASAEDKNVTVQQAAKRRLSYSATLEVLQP
jgi:uncharacterized GH25 family protein